MASMTMPSKIEKDVYTVMEPACGAGTMIIASAWAMQKNHIDYRKHSLFVAKDIDIRCVWMTYIQTLLYGIPAIVIHGNSLTSEEWSHWYSLYAFEQLRKLDTSTTAEETAA